MFCGLDIRRSGGIRFIYSMNQEQKILSIRVDIDSVQLMLSCRVRQPLYYIGLVIIIFEGVQVVGFQWAGTASNVPECITFDCINLAVGMLPKSFYSIHGTSPC